MAHPARQVFQHIINRDAKSSNAWLPSALSRLQSDDLGVVHSSIIAGLTCAVTLWDGSAPVFPGDVIVVDGFTVGAVAWLSQFRSRISKPQPNPQKVCLI